MKAPKGCVHLIGLGMLSIRADRGPRDVRSGVMHRPRRLPLVAPRWRGRPQAAPPLPFRPRVPSRLGVALHGNAETMVRTSTRKVEIELAAGAVALGGAAAAGKAVVDRRRARQEERERAFRLRRDETVPDGIRRVARGQVDVAL